MIGGEICGPISTFKMIGQVIDKQGAGWRGDWWRAPATLTDSFSEVRSGRGALISFMALAGRRAIDFGDMAEL